jgi:UDP-glucose 4-epimerase
MILIVGGAGYIGSHINKDLNKKGYQTLILDDLSSGKEALVKWGKLVVGSLGDEAVLEKIFSENKIETVMHFGAFKAAGESVVNPEKYYFNNVANTLTLLKVMKKYGVDKFIFSSSAAVYGVPQYNPMDEKHPKSPINPYGRTKLMVEEILEDYSVAYGLKYVALRYFNAAGADPEVEVGEWPGGCANLIPVIFDVVSGRKPELKVFGTDYETADGTCIRDYIHVSDLADAHVKAVEYLNNGGVSDKFNLGNGNGFSVKEVINIAKEVTGVDFKVVEAERRPGDPAILMADSKKAREILGWQPTHQDLREIVETGWKWEESVNI